ncbi:MAG: 50S ribosomal protein L10 [Patescibacteria group bacterium]|nr:50S ribosomal protein L10 [Patescibacteria group bacterium]
MAVSKQKKVEILNELVVRFKEAKSIGFATTNTMTVEDFAKLRTSLREVGATYTLAKKTIIVKAIKEAIDLDIDLANLEGQI